MKHVITISREFGSGGREIGSRLAKRLNIPFYDKEIISLASENSNLSEDFIENHDEMIVQLKNKPYTPFSAIYEIPMSDQVFLEQSRIIRKLAAKEPCVIVGRCADRVLEDSINLFIYARMNKRIERLLTMESEVDSDKMESRIREIDRKRKDYYQYYTGSTWGRAQNYDLCLDSGKIGIKATVDIILSYLEALDS